MAAPTAATLVERLRGLHLRMVDAVLAGDGLERVAELAADAVGGSVAIIIPRLGTAVMAPAGQPSAERLPGAAPLRGRLVQDRLAHAPRGLAAEIPIASGDESVGAVLMLDGATTAPGEAAEYLHLAAVASLTEVAVEEARDEVEQNLRGSFLEDLRAGSGLRARRARAPRRAAGLRPQPRRDRAVRGAAHRPSAPRRGDDRRGRARRARAAHGGLAERGAERAHLRAAAGARRRQRGRGDARRRGAARRAAAAPRDGRAVVVLRATRPSSRAPSRRPSSCSTC